jgi:hypothetical protein
MNLLYIEAESYLQSKIEAGEGNKFKVFNKLELGGFVGKIRADEPYLCVRDIKDSLDETQMEEVGMLDELLRLGFRPLVIIIYEGQINQLDILMGWLNQKSMYSVYHLLHSEFLDIEYISGILDSKSTAVDFGNYILADSNARDTQIVDKLYDLVDSTQDRPSDGIDLRSGELVGVMQGAINLITAQEATLSRIHKMEDKSHELKRVQGELQVAYDKLYNIEMEYETRLQGAAEAQLGMGSEESSVGNYTKFNTNTLKLKGKLVYFKCLDNLIYFKTLITAFNEFLRVPTSKGRAVNVTNSRIIVLDYWRPSLELEYGDCEIVTAKNYRGQQDHLQRSKKPIILTNVNSVIIKSILEEHYAQGDGILIVVDYLGYPETLFMNNPNEFYVASSIGLVSRYGVENGIDIPQERIITRGYPSDSRYTNTIGVPQIIGVAGLRLRERVAKVRNIPNVNSVIKDSKILELLAGKIR